MLLILDTTSTFILPVSTSSTYTTTFVCHRRLKRGLSSFVGTLVPMEVLMLALMYHAAELSTNNMTPLETYVKSNVFNIGTKINALTQS